MQQERIRCTPSWYGIERRDCILVTIDEDKPGFKGLSAACVLLLFSFRHDKKTYPCALIHWFNIYGQWHDPKTGLWMVRPAYYDQAQRNPCLAVVHLDTLVQGVHLIPVYGLHSLPSQLEYHQSLDVFKLFYANKYADYHSNEILFWIVMTRLNFDNSCRIYSERVLVTWFYILVQVYIHGENLSGIRLFSNAAGGWDSDYSATEPCSSCSIQLKQPFPECIEMWGWPFGFRSE